MQTKIIANDQLSGNVIKKEDGRLYFFERIPLTRAAYTNIDENGGLSINIRFSSLMNITGISVQGKAIEPIPPTNIQFTKRYAVNVSYDNEDKKSNSLGEVSRKQFHAFCGFVFSKQIYLITTADRTR